MKICGLVLMVWCASGFAPAQMVDPCATAPASCATQISTHATAQTRIANTAVDISVGVTATGKDMATVQVELSRRSATLIAYLKGQKVQRLMTAGVSFSPEIKPQKNALDKTVGYDGSQSVSFRTTPEKAPELLGGVLQNGANSIDSTSFTPTEEEIAAARGRLSAEATKTALSQAEAIAVAANLQVVAVRSVNVEDGGMVMPRMRTMMKMDVSVNAAAPVAVEAGDEALSVRVDVVAAAAARR